MITATAGPPGMFSLRGVFRGVAAGCGASQEDPLEPSMLVKTTVPVWTVKVRGAPCSLGLVYLAVYWLTLVPLIAINQVAL